MSQRDRDNYAKIKADPEKWVAYLERKRRERKARPGYEAMRKRNWRDQNREHAKMLRDAHHQVEWAIQAGDLVRLNRCEKCGTETENIEAHHYKGYAKEHWFDVKWLCLNCHAKAHYPVGTEPK